MRIAVLADIHGNMPAFEAVLDHVARQGVDRLVIAGDIVIGSPDSAVCWRLARRLECPIVRGNHERYVAHYGTAASDPAWESEQFAPLQWAARQLAEDEKQAIAELPLDLRLDGAPDLLIVHASPRSDYDTIDAHTPGEQLAAMLAGAPERVIVRAHNHVAQVRLWRDRTIVTAGSVGLPLDGTPTAKYLILERRAGGWHFEHHSVPYDLDAALRRFHESGYLAATGAMGRLFMREVATASFQIVPFLRALRGWSAEAPIGLDEALARFLSAY
jgi:predicted phosphodiesterase